MESFSTTACTGGPNGDACILRCRNQALAGPFGSCVAVANGAAAGTTAAAANMTSTAAAAPAAAAAGGAAASAAPAAEAGAADTNNAKAGGAAGLLGKLLGKNKRRVIHSRIAGKRAGYWIDE